MTTTCLTIKEIEELHVLLSHDDAVELAQSDALTFEGAKEHNPHYRILERALSKREEQIEDCKNTRVLSTFKGMRPNRVRTALTLT